MKSQIHNGTISLWKFIFCLMIIALHVSAFLNFNFYRSGSIGVEFFFLVSGIFMGKAALLNNDKENDIGKKTYNFIMAKIKKLFPYILISYAISLLVFSFTSEVPYGIHDYVNSIWDLLFLRNSGIIYRTFLGVAWYISAMLICMIGLYPMILKYKNSFLYIIGPLIVILVGGFIANKYHTIANNGNIYIMLLRALFELTLGVLIYNCSEKIKNVSFTKIGYIILNLIEIIGFTSIIVVANLDNAHLKYDFVMILILSVSLSIAVSEKTVFYKVFSNKYLYYLEKLSLPMYLNQYFIIKVISLVLDVNNCNYYLFLLGVIMLDLLLSIISLNLVRIISNIFNKHIKELVIKMEVKA